MSSLKQTCVMGKLALLCLIVLVGCSTPEPPPLTDEAPAATARQVPPTFTPQVHTIPEPPAVNTRVPEPAAVSGSPTPHFNENVVELRYAIPALGLDRRLQGNVASQLTLIDETTGQSRQRGNQVGILLELQQILSGLELAPLPDGCDACVHFEYRLPLSDAAASGWLQDPVLLASVENFMAVMLGPHSPPGAVVSLRRSASPFAPAHTVALMADGRLWRWLATEPEVGEPAASEPALPALFNDVPTTTLDEEYVANCMGSPVETLTLITSQGSREVSIVCPEFSLPSTLLPLYLQLDAALAPILAEVSLPRPPTAMPLAALLDYRREDGSRLTLYQDSTAIAIAADKAVYTSTVATTQVSSLATGLLASGELQPGLHTFTREETGMVTPSSLSGATLLVRGPEGVYDGQWSHSANVAALEELNTLLNSLVGQAASEPEEVETPQVLSTETVTPQTTPEPTAPATTAP